MPSKRPQRPRPANPRPRALPRVVEDDEDVDPDADRRRPGLWGWLTRPAPTGGPRMAVAYAVALVAAVLGMAPAAALVSQLYTRKAICPGDDYACPIVSLFVGMAGATALLLLVGAILGRLGILWWLLTCGLALGVFQLVGADATNPLFLLVLFVPVASTLLTDPADVARRRWRLLGAWLLTAVLAIELAVQIVLALR